MSRLNAVLVAAGLAVGAVGCAHCDTCDDFPAPCVGPNCGGANGAYGTSMPYPGPGMTTTTTGPVTTSVPASLGPVNDAAPAPPGTGSIPPAPAVNPGPDARPAPPSTSTPPLPSEPAPRAARPGA